MKDFGKWHLVKSKIESLEKSELFRVGRGIFTEIKTQYINIIS